MTPRPTRAARLAPDALRRLSAAVFGSALRPAAGLLAAALTVAAPAAAGPAGRIVSVGGAVTEIVVALGHGGDLAAVDTTSLYPPAVVAPLPKVGYMRQLSAEGVIALRPDPLLVVEGTGPADALRLIGDAGVPVTVVPERFSAAGVAAKIRAVGAALGAGPAADTLATANEARFARLTAGNAAVVRPVRVLFALSAQGGRLMAAGRGTAADAALRLAGAVNALDGFDGYKPVADEAVIAAAPDAVVVMENGGQPAAEILATPVVAATPAGKAGRLFTVDGVGLLGFGPRTAAEAAALRARLYPAIAFPPVEAAP
jgi:iron complex transport system substrate-binding protein